jgi:hypothetical protein
MVGPTGREGQAVGPISAATSGRRVVVGGARLDPALALRRAVPSSRTARAS